MGNRIVSIIASVFMMLSASAQQYYGMNGLINVPSADMDTVPVAHIGAHYLNKRMVPDMMKLDGRKFNSWSNYLSIQPFRWLEVGYGYTLWKFHKNKVPTAKVGYYAKDRYFSGRVQPVREKKWWPSVVIGGQDVWGSKDRGESGSNYYRNFYIAASKHVDLWKQSFGFHLAYRYWWLKGNKRWNGVVGGLTYQPSFYKPLRFIGEYDGQYANIGADCTLWRYVTLQASLQKCKYFSGGIGIRVPFVRMGHSGTAEQRPHGFWDKWKERKEAKHGKAQSDEEIIK